MIAFDTTFPADTVEFCPHPNALNIFACGTYKLEAHQIHNKDNELSSPQYRRGQCLLFEVDPSSYRDFRQIQALDLPAVPDMKWYSTALGINLCHRSNLVSPVLAIADSEGSITLHEWQETERILKQIDSIRCASTDILCLSLDWSNRRAPGVDFGCLIVSLSNGSLCLLRSNDEHGLSMTDSWQAHDYEAWVAAWNYWDTNIIYSGGDDLKMKGWDIRQGFQQPTFVNKSFDAGVTSIQSHPHIEHMLAVGSYNDTVKLFDMRKPLIPLTDINVGGGAWRIKWHPSSTRKNDLLVACMHDGFKIVRFNLRNQGKEGSGEVIKRFDSHKSLAYGGDWSFGSFLHDETLIGTCSFYDHALYLWSG